MPSILLIDDNRKLLSELHDALKEYLEPDEAEIRTWMPSKVEPDPQTSFSALVDAETVLVITDYDLTTQGLTGLFGSSIVGWCQARGIPVGDFSRGNPGNLPKEPNLFELRVPTQEGKAAPFIASIYRGFKSIGQAIARDPELLKTKRSPAAVLAHILGAPTAESQFALYGVRLGTTNAALVDKIVRTAPTDMEPSEQEKKALLGYIVGHLLLNAVLRFPGPIISTRGLMAYVGSNASEASTIGKLFTSAVYKGPFSDLEQSFWISEVDELLDQWAQRLPAEFKAETQGEFNRAVLELKLDRPLLRPSCKRCQGANGGFLCPFTHNTVCQRPDCSVGSNSWVPQGARLCRIERDFYEEWAPILGI